MEIIKAKEIQIKTQVKKIKSEIPLSSQYDGDDEQLSTAMLHAAHNPVTPVGDII